MIRALLAATALTTSMSMAALAQNDDTSTEMGTDMEAQVEAPMDADTGVDAETDMNMSVEADDMAADNMSADTASSVSLSAGYMQSDDDFLGSKILGATVWSSSAEDADKIGDINDIIFNANGRMIAAIIGIGGFLEIGEKSVAVGFEELEWTTDFNGEPRLVLSGATYASLEAAPEFVWEMPDLAADPMMTEMETGGALDADSAMDVEATPMQGDTETDALLDAEGDTTMDTDGDTPAADVDADAAVDAEVDVNG